MGRNSLIRNFLRRNILKVVRSKQRKYSVNPRSAVEVAIRALPQERFTFCRVSIAGRIALPLRSAMSEL